MNPRPGWDITSEHLSGAQRPDIRPAGMGACTCPPGTLYGGCECGWGLMVQRLMWLGYGPDADAVTIARQAQDTSVYAAETVRRARIGAVQSLARTWTGSVAALGRLVGLGGQRVTDLVPGVAELVENAVRKANQAGARRVR